MKVIDTRSGEEMTIGKTVQYGRGEKLTLLDFEPGLFSATAVIETTYRDYGAKVDIQREDTAPLVTKKYQIPIRVRWTHPRYFLEHVAFIPS